MTRLAPLALFALFALSLSLTAAVGCGSTAAVDDTDQAAAAQALIDGGDTEEGATGDAGASDEDALDEADPSADCDLGHLRARVIAKYDTDGDGRLDNGEAQALQDDVEAHPVLARALDRHRIVRRVVMARLHFIYDANNDGVLDDGEKLALKDDLLARCAARKAQILTHFDADGDGKIDNGEGQTL
ncbi:MAG TPA: hypothetical protein VGO62_11475, partial [Myxococcota bacterium]